VPRPASVATRANSRCERFRLVSARRTSARAGELRFCFEDPRLRHPAAAKIEKTRIGWRKAGNDRSARNDRITGLRLDPEKASGDRRVDRVNLAHACDPVVANRYFEVTTINSLEVDRHRRRVD
jgi:hypothetical protein